MRSTSRRQSVRSGGGVAQAEPVAHDPREALGLEVERHLVDVAGVDRRDHRPRPGCRRRARSSGGCRPVSGRFERSTRTSGSMPMRRSSLTECWVVLVFSSPTESRYGHEGHVHEADVLAADVVAQLPDRLEERQRLDVADRPADLDDDDLGVRAGRRLADARLDLVGDVRDHLHGGAEEVAAPLLLDDRVVDRAGGHVGDARQVLVGEALVVPEVEVGLGPVLGDVDLAVLERAHRARVDVEVGVALLQRHREPARLEEGPQRRRGDALAEAGDDASGHEDVLHRRLSHAPSPRPTTPSG